MGTIINTIRQRIFNGLIYKVGKEGSRRKPCGRLCGRLCGRPYGRPYGRPCGRLRGRLRGRLCW